MEKKFKLQPPLMPNFITIDSPAGKRQDGLNHKPAIPVQELSKEEAIEYGELMKQTFIQHWRLKTINVPTKEI